MATIDKHLNRRFGFTCQAWLATDIANRHFGRAHRIWFSTELNPPRNGSSSNPLVLYQELEQIIHTNDFNHSRIEQFRRRLSGWISGQSVMLSSTVVAKLTAEISKAPVRAFRPSLWKIDLATIDISRLIHLGQFPDEFQIRNLVDREYEVVSQ